MGYKIVTPNQIIGMNDNVIEELNASIAVPSAFHTYSILTEYIKKWFMNRCNGIFTDKNITIEAKHPYDDIRRLVITDLLKRSSPVCAITPKINLEYHRDFLDTHMFGIDHYIQRGRLDNSIIRDFNKNLFVGYVMEQLSIGYSFLFKVESKAQQIDLYKILTMNIPFGHIYEDEIDMDFHIPYSVMRQFAKDAGYNINEKNEIQNIVNFTKYINSISRLPVMYKFRTVNGRTEFFMRFNKLDLKIDLQNMPGYDDGERKGQIQKNYRLDFDIEVKIPSVKLFAYYSSNRHELMNMGREELPETEVIYPIQTIEMTTIPKVNSKGWMQYILSEYYDENTDDYITIEFRDLLRGNIEMDRVFEECELLGYSPDNFIEFKIYNGLNKDLPFTIDWKNYTLTYNIKVEDNTSFISVYLDTEHIHERLISLDNMDGYSDHRYKD